MDIPRYTLLTAALLAMAPPALSENLELNLARPGSGFAISGSLESVNFVVQQPDMVDLFLDGKIEKPASDRGKSFRCVLTIEGDIANAAALYNLIAQSRNLPESKVFCITHRINQINQGATTLAIVRLGRRDKDSQDQFNLITRLK